MKVLALVTMLMVLAFGLAQAGYWGDYFEEREQESRERWGWCCEEPENPWWEYRYPKESHYNVWVYEVPEYYYEFPGYYEDGLNWQREGRK